MKQHEKLLRPWTDSGSQQVKQNILQVNIAEVVANYQK